MKISLALLLTLPFAAATNKFLRNPFTSADEEPCCQNACTDPSQNKYYSIDTRHDLCGECCMADSDYKKYKIFEPGLEKADNDNPCSGFGYPKYTETVTHGALNIKMTLDLYDHADAKVGADTCSDTETLCEWSEGKTECCTQGEMCIPNVGCRC